MSLLEIYSQALRRIWDNPLPEDPSGWKYSVMLRNIMSALGGWAGKRFLVSLRERLSRVPMIKFPIGQTV
jgi:hypothetical protein